MANNLLISYDLITPNQNYDGVISKIKELGSWAKIQDSHWYVKSSSTASEARDHIKPAMDSDDNLFVVDASNGQAAWYGIEEEASEFIREIWND